MKCQYCNKESKKNNLNSLKNHERLCKMNPNRQHTKFLDNSWQKQKGTNQYIKAKETGEILNIQYKKRDPMSEEQKKKLSKIAKERGFGGYRENAGRSKKFYVDDSYGKRTCLQSTYEYRCYEILTELGIEWYRPKALKYNKTKNYFADFYLPKYDIYLDPKNDYKASKDTDKIASVIRDNNVNLHVILEEGLTKEFILNLCS